jgi:DNA-binding cell septation regulator SpoVG
VTVAKSAPDSEIRVVTIKAVNKGSLRALVDIGLGPSLIVREFRVIQQPGQRAWVSPPTREWQGTDGKRHFAPLVELAGSLKERVEQTILQAWARADGGSSHGR